MKSYLTIGLATLLALAFYSPPAFGGNGNWRGSGNWRGNGNWQRDRDRDDGRDRRHHRRQRDNNETVVISDDNNDFNYNNANYLGYPPWYRLNYYTPWMSDYRNGTAWTNIPSSHAAEGYGMPSSYNTMPSGYYQWLAANAAANAYASAPAPYAGGIPPGGNDGAPMALAGNDIVVVVQRELRRRGFYQGLINGVSDDATRRAIRCYESRAGLPATGGIIGIELLRSLGLLQ